MSNKPMDKLLSEFGFVTPIPDEIITALPAIKPSGLAVWCYLMSRIYNAKRTEGNFDCFPGIDLISKETGVGRGTVIKAINLLEEAGLLTKKRRFGNSTIYTLTSSNVRKSKNCTTEGKPPEVQNLDYQKSKNETIEVQKLDTNQYEDNQDKESNQEEDININASLQKLGIKPSAIKTLINEKTIERLQHGIDVYEQGLLRKKELKPGWFMDFINEDWDDPSWYEPDPDNDTARQRYLNGLED